MASTHASVHASKSTAEPTIWVEQLGYGNNGTSYPGQWADDFTVPEGETFTVTDVRLELRIDENNSIIRGVPDSGFEIAFFADAGGVPASTPLIEAYGMTTYTQAPGPHEAYPLYTVQLDEPAVFTTGTYWLAVATGKRLEDSSSEFYFFLRRVAEQIDAESQTLVRGREGWQPAGNGFAFALLNIPRDTAPEPDEPEPDEPEPDEPEPDEPEPNEAPVARIEGPDAAQEGRAAPFDGGGSTDADGDALQYEWDADFDGGTFDVDGTGQQFEHTYTQSGTYTVGLRVFDGTVYSPVVTATVDVTRIPLEVGTVEVQSSTIKAGVPFVLRVPFTGPSSNTRHDYTCTIDLGSGIAPQSGVVTGSKPGNLTCLGNKLVYPAPGTYSATVTVTDSDGRRGQATTRLDVQVHNTQKLKLTSMCSDDPATARRWRVRNPNAFAVNYTWAVVGTNQQGERAAAPGDSFFTTKAVSGPNTTKIYWVDDKGKERSTVKASGGAACSS